MLKNKYQILPHTTHDKADEAKLIQTKDEAIDVKDWHIEEEWDEYPEGARDKALLQCTSPSPYGFLKDGHRYIFKLSFARYPEQFWMEVFSYRLGIAMQVPVPPAFVAYNSITNQCGALIEWFFKLGAERFISGGDYCEIYISNYERKKGKQHNFELIIQIFEELVKNNTKFKEDWKDYWAKTLVFDALIGNTDRHQDNWGVIKNPINGEMRIAPAFDNGTSLGCEILVDNFNHYDDLLRLEKYISKGWHHLRWSLSHTHSMGHLELLQKLADLYPHTRQIMLSCLKMVDSYIISNILKELVAFDIPVRLNHKRAAFMLKLLKFRHQRLLNGLEK